MPNHQSAISSDEAVRDAQEQLRIVVDAMAAPVVRCSRDLRYLWVSRAYADRFGRRPDEIVGRSIVDVIGAEALAAIRPYIDRVLAGERVEYEERIRFEGSGHCWIHGVYTPTIGADGAVDGWVAVVLDVGASRRQQALLESIFRADPGALALLVGPDLRCAFANEAYRELLAQKLDPTGRRYDEVWPDEAMRSVEARLRQVMFAKTALRVEREERVVASGERRVFTSHACPIAWGGQMAVLSVLWETTDLEQARQQAEARAAELATILDAIPDGLVLYAPDGRIVAMNAVAERLLRIPREDRDVGIAERWGRLNVDLGGGRALAPGDLPVARALRGETVTNLEMRVRFAADPAAKATWVSVGAAPIRGSDGGLRGAVATYTDISRLRELHEEREDLMRMASHDLRTPLTVILGHAQWLSRGSRGADEVRRRAEQIRTSGERMAAMIQEMVDVIRLEAKKVPAASQSLNVNAAIRELLERLAGALPIGRVQVVGSAPPAQVDAAAFERLLVNLVTNALKYSPGSEPVEIRLGKDRQGVKVAVADRGPGIPEADRGRIFERFYRTRDARTEGLGLGLYITRMLVESMGGRIDVHSTLGQGSVFTLTLPCPDAERLAEPTSL